MQTIGVSNCCIKDPLQASQWVGIQRLEYAWMHLMNHICSHVALTGSGTCSAPKVVCLHHCSFADFLLVCHWLPITSHYHSFRSLWVSLTWHVHTPGGCVNQASHNNLRIRCLPFRVSLQRLDSHVPTQKYWHSHCVSCGSGCGHPLRMDKWCNMDARFWGKSEGGAVELWLLWCSQGSKPTHVIWELFASKSSGIWFPTELL